MEKHTRDDKTGLLFHAWDDSKGMKWSDDVTGQSLEKTLKSDQKHF